MSRFSRIEVATLMKQIGLIPMFYHPDVNIGKQILKACYDGGARVVEFTSRGDFAHEVFSELNKYVIKELPEMAMGAGSVTDAAAASLYMQMGANFIVTPSLREDIAVACNRRKVLWNPGCGSVTEINKAEEMGCELIKLFPGANFGPDFVKAIKGPQPWTSIMPTGGVTLEESNLRSWFDAGATCVGIGSNLISSSILANKDYTGLEQTVRNTLAIIKKVRGIEL